MRCSVAPRAYNRIKFNTPSWIPTCAGIIMVNTSPSSNKIPRHRKLLAMKYDSLPSTHRQRSNNSRTLRDLSLSLALPILDPYNPKFLL